MDDKFSVAFEFYINVGHALVERAGVSRDFCEMAWKQVEAGIRGETSLDAWESRKLATANGPDAERYKTEYLRSDVVRHDLDLPAVAVPGRGLLRFAGARLSAARAFCPGRAVAQNCGAVPAQLRIRIRGPLQAALSPRSILSERNLMASATASRTPHWYGIPVRVFLLTFHRDTAVFRRQSSSRDLRHVDRVGNCAESHPDMRIAYRQIALPTAMVGGGLLSCSRSDTGDPPLPAEQDAAGHREDGLSAP